MNRFWINLIALVAVVAVNALANILPINGQTTGEISDRLNVLFTPAGYVFSIWGFIYLLLFVWVLRQALRRNRDRDVYVKTAPWFVLSSVFNITWILLWHYEQFTVSVFVIIGLLLSLIVLYRTIQKTEHTFLDRLPFSVYMGWVSVATIANISYTLTYNNWNGFGISPVIWTIILLVVAAALALHIRYHERDWVYPLVFIWAIIGIGVRNEGIESVVVFTAYVIAAVIAVGIFTVRKKKNRSRNRLRF